MRILRTLIALIFVLASAASAQHPGYLNGNNETGIPDYGSFIHTSIDSVNLQNGGVNIRLPFLSRKMRGFDYTVGVRYDSKLWVVDKFAQNNGSSNQLWGWWRIDQDSGWQRSTSFDSSVEWNETEVYCPAIYVDGEGNTQYQGQEAGGQVQVAPEGWMAIRHSYIMKTGDGTKTTFPTRKIHEVSTPPNSCQDYQNSLAAINNLTGHSTSGHTLLDITNDHLGLGVNYKLTYKDGSWQLFAYACSTARDFLHDDATLVVSETIALGHPTIGLQRKNQRSAFFDS